MAQDDTNDISSMTFEQALAALETIVRDLESGEAPLENAISSYERGTALKKHCEAKLNEARMKIEKITIDSNGQPKTEPLDAA